MKFYKSTWGICAIKCAHCHVDAGPDRKEIMSKDTMQLCLEVLKKSNVTTLDLTGGAPEMNPNFRWFVEQAYKIGVQDFIVRSNLTIIMANKKYHDLPEFFKTIIFMSYPLCRIGPKEKLINNGGWCF